MALETLQAAVGSPADMTVSLFDLILPPHDWTQIFKIASDKDIQKMALSIKTYGLLHRITVWDNGQGKYIILGGITRYSAFRYLYYNTNDEKWTAIPVSVYGKDQIDRLDAKRIFLISNTDQRRSSTRDIINAYYHLLKIEKQRAYYGSGIFARDAAAKEAEVAPSKFSMYLKLKNLIPELLDEIDKRNLGLTCAFHLAFISQEFQNYIFQKKYYLDIQQKTAKKIRIEAKNFEDIDRIVTDAKLQPKVFKYDFVLDEKVPKNYEILPLFIDKDAKDKVISFLHQAITNSNFSDDIKVNLLKSLN